MDFLADFGVQPLLLAAQVVNFLILLFILKKFLYKPILKVLETRKNRITLSLKQAEEIEKKLEQTKEQVDKMLAKASLDRQKIIDEANFEANQIIEDTKVRAASMAQKTLEQAEIQIGAEKEKMKWELRKDFSKMVMLVVQKVTGKILNQKGQKQLIDRAVKEFKS